MPSPFIIGLAIAALTLIVGGIGAIYNRQDAHDDAEDAEALTDWEAFTAADTLD